jgi:hypothetical protein
VRYIQRLASQGFHSDELVVPGARLFQRLSFRQKRNIVLKVTGHRSRVLSPVPEDPVVEDPHRAAWRLGKHHSHQRLHDKGEVTRITHGNAKTTTSSSSPDNAVWPNLPEAVTPMNSFPQRPAAASPSFPVLQPAMPPYTAADKGKWKVTEQNGIPKVWTMPGAPSTTIPSAPSSLVGSSTVEEVQGDAAATHSFSVDRPSLPAAASSSTDDLSLRRVVASEGKGKTNGFSASCSVSTPAASAVAPVGGPFVDIDIGNTACAVDRPSSRRLRHTNGQVHRIINGGQEEPEDPSRPYLKSLPSPLTQTMDSMGNQLSSSSSEYGFERSAERGEGWVKAVLVGGRAM